MKFAICGCGGICYKEYAVVANKGVTGCCFAATVGHNTGDHEIFHSLSPQALIQAGGEESTVPVLSIMASAA